MLPRDPETSQLLSSTNEPKSKIVPLELKHGVILESSKQFD